MEAQSSSHATGLPSTTDDRPNIDKTLLLSIASRLLSLYNYFVDTYYWTCVVSAANQLVVIL